MTGHGRAAIGCSGWNYPHWRDVFYPRGLSTSHWLERYAATFETVEVNATFYRLPTRKATERWAEETPPGFTFTIKASRYLTHVKRLREVADGWARLAGRIDPIIEAGKLGPVLWQLPERFHRDDDRLSRTLASLPPWRHAFEFRHASWFVPEVEEILRAHDAALVIGDHVQRPFQTRDRTASWMFVRFHHGHGPRGSYSRTELRTWAARVRDWLDDGDVYAYFNDDWSGYALREAVQLRELVAEPAHAVR
jgi:uncharacterized protein YecE (DUF72 family)